MHVQYFAFVVCSFFCAWKDIIAGAADTNRKSLAAVHAIMCVQYASRNRAATTMR